MKQVEVQIMGQGYLLGCPEGGEARLQAAVDRVDDAMCKIRDAGKIKARDRIAVLAALNLAYRLAQKSDPAADTPATGTAPAHRDAPPALSDIEVDGLVRQLDAALGADGHLL